MWFLPTQPVPTASIYSLLLALTQVVGCELHWGYLHLNECLFDSPKAYCSFGGMESFTGCFILEVLRQYAHQRNKDFEYEKTLEL